MSQFDFGDLESPLSGEQLVNDELEPWRDALHSNHSGVSRPSYVVAGMLWINTTTNPWVVNFFDGSQDVPLGTLNTSTHIFSFSGVARNADNLQFLASATTALTNLGGTTIGKGIFVAADASAVRTLLALGSLATQSGTFSGTSSGTNTGDQSSVSGNAGTATALQTPRNINGQPFDGTADITISGGGTFKQSVRTTSGNFTTPSTITTSTVFKITLTGGGGGGGGGGGSGASGSGGGAAGTLIKWVSGLSPSTNYTVVIGAGGVGGNTNIGITPTDGGNSTIVIGAVTYTAGGGSHGNDSGLDAGPANSGGSGSPTNGTINIPGGDGFPGLTNKAGAGGASHWGGGGAPGVSVGSGNQAGRAAGPYGAGGGGGCNSASTGVGGAGKGGIFIAEWTE